MDLPFGPFYINDDSWDLVPEGGTSDGFFSGLRSAAANPSGSASCPSIDTQKMLCGSDKWTTSAMVSGGCPSYVCIIGLSQNDEEND